MGTLFIVATPLGNLDDITIRAIKTLFSVDGIACEDTRKTGLLLRELAKRYPDLAVTKTGERSQRLLSLYEENEIRRIPEVLTALRNGLNIALVSDAGTPAISDPGFRLIRECVKERIPVDSLPGPSSPIVALTFSGLPTDKFTFLGYPPRKGGHRLKFLQNVKQAQEHLPSTFIMFEAPHRLLTTLEELQTVFGDIQIVICREMTKMHQEVRHEALSEAITHFKKVTPRGEFVITFNTKEQNGLNTPQE
ncbi:MAG TPA: 16S rRNA (cytidine(1402)-2'-O)-methyltransferase [Patescibacteria group bacterium]|nr:16S rRNA (cytidine(1402)-2'-O)-methyltransferase [Patescibacteria group bacterium]